MRADGPGPPVLLVHGIGLGAWYWERDQRVFAELGLSSWAVDLPGHGADAGADARLSDCYDAIESAVRSFDEPPVLVGHSAGGLIAQVVATRCTVASLVLVAPVPCGSVPHVPTRRGLKAIAPALLSLATGRGLDIGRRGYLDTGLAVAEPAMQAHVLDRITPWPNGMVRDLARRRPPIRRDELDAPVLVLHGLLDGASSLYGSRLLADHFDCVFWRFDDVAHLPAIEPGGERVARAMAEWILAPHGRRVREIDAFRPDEGVGAAARQARDPAPARSDSRFGDRRKRR